MYHSQFYHKWVGFQSKYGWFVVALLTWVWFSLINVSWAFRGLLQSKSGRLDRHPFYCRYSVKQPVGMNIDHRNEHIKKNGLSLWRWPCSTTRSSKSPRNLHRTRKIRHKQHQQLHCVTPSRVCFPNNDLRGQNESPTWLIGQEESAQFANPCSCRHKFLLFP